MQDFRVNMGGTCTIWSFIVIYLFIRSKYSLQQVEDELNNAAKTVRYGTDLSSLVLKIGYNLQKYFDPKSCCGAGNVSIIIDPQNIAFAKLYNFLEKFEPSNVYQNNKNQIDEDLAGLGIKAPSNRSIIIVCLLFYLQQNISRKFTLDKYIGYLKLARDSSDLVCYIKVAEHVLYVGDNFKDLKTGRIFKYITIQEYNKKPAVRNLTYYIYADKNMDS
jgi:hypothetical protein